MSVNPAILQAVRKANLATTGSASPTPAKQSQGMAVQSVAQSMAIAVQDATDLLRNVSTIETTAIGVATSKWISEPANLLYKPIIDQSMQVMQETAKVFSTIGNSAGAIVGNFPGGK